MIKINTIYQKAVRIQKRVCGLLFSIFSFVYLFIFQRDVLEALHFSLANGKTHFSPFGSALVMTLTLLLLTWGINMAVTIKGKFHSLIYIPAFFVLVSISDIERDIFTNGGNSMWLWLLPVLLGAFICIGIIGNKLFPAIQTKDVTTEELIGSNIFFLILGCIFTLSVSNTDENLHHELEIERYIREKDFTKAMKVGQYSLDVTQNLTALRAMALSNAGMLGDKFFTYPQYYGANGLFLLDNPLQTLRYTNDSIYCHLGARPYNGGNKIDYLRSLCYEDKGKFTALHYYLLALLLDKQVDAFAAALNDFYEPEDSLPVHLKEAVVMYQSVHPTYKFATTDSMLIQKYATYKKRQGELTSPVEEKNQMRREFGDTYWWYHDYQK